MNRTFSTLRAAWTSHERLNSDQYYGYVCKFYSRSNKDLQENKSVNSAANLVRSGVKNDCQCACMT